MYLRVLALLLASGDCGLGLAVECKQPLLLTDYRIGRITAGVIFRRGFR